MIREQYAGPKTSEVCRMYGLSAAERAKMARLANVAEHVFLLMKKLSRAYRHAARAHEEVLDGVRPVAPFTITANHMESRLAEG